MRFKSTSMSVVLLLSSFITHAAPDKAQLLVWANEAIIATYTYNYKSFDQDQKTIARYFSTKGWLSYNRALNIAKLPEAVKRNAYDVSAVATRPPQLVTLDPTHWAVVMPILVEFNNPQYKEQQNLKITLSFSEAAQGQGVRGLNIDALKAVPIKPPCECTAESSDH